MLTGHVRRSGPTVVAVAVAVVAGLGLVTSGCESCQPSARYHKRQVKEELRNQLCERGSYYLECASALVNRYPTPGAPPHTLSVENCQDLVSTLMDEMCGDVDVPDSYGQSLREAWLSCLWGSYVHVSIIKTIAGVGGRADGRCGDPTAWDEIPATVTEAELRLLHEPRSPESRGP